MPTLEARVKYLFATIGIITSSLVIILAESGNLKIHCTDFYKSVLVASAASLKIIDPTK